MLYLSAWSCGLTLPFISLSFLLVQPQEKAGLSGGGRGVRPRISLLSLLIEPVAQMRAHRSQEQGHSCMHHLIHRHGLQMQFVPSENAGGCLETRGSQDEMG